MERTGTSRDTLRRSSKRPGWLGLALDAVSVALVLASLAGAAVLTVAPRLHSGTQASPAGPLTESFVGHYLYPLLFLCGLVAFLMAGAGEGALLSRTRPADPVRPPLRLKALTFAVWTLSTAAPAALSAFLILRKTGGLPPGEERLVLLSLSVLTMLASAAGIRNTAAGPGAEETRRWLVAGTVLMSLGILLSGRNAEGHPGLGDLLAFILATQLSIARKRRTELLGRDEGNTRRSWATGALVLFVLCAFLAGAAGLGDEALTGLARLFVRLGRPFVRVFDYLLIPIGYVVGWIVGFLRRFVNPEALSLLQELGEMDNQQQLERVKEAARSFAPWVSWVFAALGLVLFGWVLWRLISVFAREPETREFTERRENLPAGESLRSWGNEVLTGIHNIIGRSLETLGRTILVRRPPETIEELYSFALRALERHGISKDPSDTPFEHLSSVRLRITAGDYLGALTFITELFSRCHYSMKPPGSAEWQKALRDYEVLLKEDPGVLPSIADEPR